MNNLSVERFNRAEDVGHAKPKDALIAAIEELDQFNVKSVMIICVVDDEERVTYFAGPNVSNLRKVWMLLQREVMRVIERMIDNEI